jgi:hypothetical protein
MIRFYEIRRTNDIVRWCRHCGISNNDIRFLVEKDSKSGKFYTHSICKPCFLTRRSEVRIKYYKKYRKKEIAKSRKWNLEHKDRYNEQRRKNFLEKFYGKKDYL